MSTATTPFTEYELEQAIEADVMCINDPEIPAVVAAKHGTPCTTFYCVECRNRLRWQITGRTLLYCNGCQATDIPPNAVTLRDI